MMLASLRSSSCLGSCSEAASSDGLQVTKRDFDFCSCWRTMTLSSLEPTCATCLTLQPHFEQCLDLFLSLLLHGERPGATYLLSMFHPDEFILFATALQSRPTGAGHQLSLQVMTTAVTVLWSIYGFVNGGIRDPACKLSSRASTAPGWSQTCAASRRAVPTMRSSSSKSTP